MTASARIGLIATTVLTVGLLGAASPAAASTFCVPGFHAACPANGTNVAQPDLETAMESNASDGIPDRVVIDAVTLTDPDSFVTTGTDDLEVVGAGPDKTYLTTASNGGVWVVNLDFASSREVTMRDLTVLIPATVAPNSVGIHSDGDTFDNVDIVSRRAEVAGISPAEGGTVFRDGALIPDAGGSFSAGFYVAGSAEHTGTLLIERTTITGARRGVSVEKENTPVVLRRVQVLDPTETAVGLSDGNDLTIENSVLQSGSGAPVYLFNNTTEVQEADLTNVTVDSSTGDATEPAIYGEVQAANGVGPIDVEVDSSIIRGFDKTWELVSPIGQTGIGDAHIALRHSNFLPAGTNVGNGTTYVAPNNTEGDPRFRGPGDYRLLPDSPAIDAGRPDAAPALDLGGDLRPADGDEDGTAVIDQGAYEYLPPLRPRPVCETNPTLCPGPPPGDTTAPAISRISFLPPTAKRRGYLKFALSEAATVRAVLKPMPAGKGERRRKTVRLTKRGRAGLNKSAIRKGAMKPGRYRLTLSATDPAGNRSAVTGKLRVKSPG